MSSETENRYLLGALLCALLGVGIAVYTGAWDLGEFEESGWVHHDKLTTVYSHNWATGEYKQCANVNAKTDEPYLQCDDLTVTEEGKVFKVRFYGRTYEAGKPFETTFNWRCRKTGDIDPAIVCERQPERKK